MSIYVNSGMYAYDYTLTNNFMHIYSGGTADQTTLNTGGSILVSSGGTIQNTRLNSEETQVWNGVGWYWKLAGDIVVSEGGLGLDTVITTGSSG